MYSSKKTLVFIFWVIVSQNVLAQFSSPVPLNENVTSGKLDNGLAYYILHNEEPKDRMSFYFVQNVGAILEDDSQNGLAHFLEHMAFNGTEHFKGKSIIKMLEGNGVRFGHEINAYTAQDETVYNISKVPADREKLLDSCLLVLHDWSGSLLLEEDEIDAERGVIREEWRTRRNSAFRLKAQTDQVLYMGSIYAQRDVIGSLDVINNFKYQELHDYYKKWYRPDQQAVIIVGDVDVSRMEEKVKKMFSPIPMSQNAPERQYYTIPDNEELLFGTATDKEANYMTATLRYKKPFVKIKDKNNTRNNVLGTFYKTILNKRYQELLQKPESAGLHFSVGFSPVSRLTNTFYISATAKKGQTIKAFREAYIEAERVRKQGFIPAELDRTKKEFISAYDNFLKNKDKVDNDTWAERLMEYHLKANPFLSPEKDYELIVGIIRDISLDELNTFSKTLQTENNRVLLLTGPDDAEFPTKETFLKEIETITASDLSPYEENENNEPLISGEDMQGSNIVGQFAVAGISGAQGYTLGNGARVVLYPTEYSRDQVLFSAFGKGGKSLVGQEDLVSAEIATTVAKASGLGTFNATALQKKLAGKVVSVSPYIGTYTEGLEGSSNQEDMETLLQLAYLYFEKPRFDPEIYQVLLSQYQNALGNIKANHGKAFRDTVNFLNTGHSPRTLVFDEDFVKDINLEKAAKTYRARVHNAADFTFVFVGNINEKALSLIQKYIGSIPGDGHTPETYNDHREFPAKGETSRHFEWEMDVPKTTAYLHLAGPLDYSRENAIGMYVIGELLSKRFLETIREDEGGSYGVMVKGNMIQVPAERFDLTINFDCDPDKQNELMGIVQKELRQLQTGLPNASDLEEIKKSLVKKRQEDIKDNSFWSGAIYNVVMYGNGYLEYDKYTKWIDSITGEKIHRLARRILKDPDRVKVIMSPIIPEK